MKRIDRELTEAEAWKALESAEYGTLSCVLPDGSPYGVPISFAILDGALVFHGAPEPGQKRRALAENPRASFSAVASTEVLPRRFTTLYEAAIAQGTIRSVDDPDLRHRALMALIEKYSPAFLEAGEKYARGAGPKTDVYLLEVERITGKANR